MKIKRQSHTIENTMSKDKKIVLTGDRPTGALHLGHYVGSIKSRVLLQEQYPAFYMVADMQALTDYADEPERVRTSVLEVVLDNLASGVNPKKTTFFIQSQIPEISELFTYFLNLVTVARLKRNPTVKEEMRQKKYGENVPAGFLAYPVSQAADILFCKANIVPVGEDQLPMIEQANEIVDKFNALHGKTFSRIEAYTSSLPRLSGVDGKAKMSKSLGNAILLSDSAEVIEKKVMQMYTDPEHVRAQDPGRIKGNVVFEYLDVFDSEKRELEELKNAYQKGGVGDVEVKKRLAGILNEMLEPIRSRRADFAKDKKGIVEILRSGTEEARKAAQETLEEVKQKMHLDYFAKN